VIKAINCLRRRKKRPIRLVFFIEALDKGTCYKKCHSM
jgi:hypothetical protein